MIKSDDKVKKPTIRDIANRTGLSVATVSRALHDPGSPFVSENARQRVQLAADDLGYVPNLSARALIRGTTGAIGFWMADAASPYYWMAARELTLETRLRYIHLAINSLSYIPEKPAETIALLSGTVDGIIAMDVTDNFEHLIQPLIQSRVPLVTIGASVSQDTDFIQLDLAAGAQLAIDHLIATGRKRIALMINLTAIEYGDPRLIRYEQILNAQGITPIYISTPSQKRHDARVRIKEFLSTGADIDAALCINDEVAIGCYRGLCDLGVSVPDDIAIVGFDGIEDTEYHYHPISTVAAPIPKICQQALQLVQERIREPLLPLRHITIAPDLIIRESSFMSQDSRLDDQIHDGGGAL